MLRKSFRVWGAVLVLAQVALPACSTMSESEQKTWGAVGGAVVGAGVGAAVTGKKNRTGGMLIGAAVGAGAGYLLASSFGSKATPEERAKPEFKEAQVEFDKGKEAQASGQHEEAIGHYQKSAAKAPEQPEPHVNMGYAYLDKDDRAHAEECFRKALTIDPDCAEAKAGLENMGLKA
jgi:tetratricopeptide (TPR) repeat protein